jgi:hypothetical protein
MLFFVFASDFFESGFPLFGPLRQFLVREGEGRLKIKA